MDPFNSKWPGPPSAEADWGPGHRRLRDADHQFGSENTVSWPPSAVYFDRAA